MFLYLISVILKRLCLYKEKANPPIFSASTHKSKSSIVILAILVMWELFKPLSW